MAAARSGHSATLLPDGRVLAVGGFGNPSTNKSAELYDPALGTWTATDSLPAPIVYHTATLLPGGKVLVVGGFDPFASQRAAYLYDPATGVMTATGDLVTARGDHTATLLNNGQVLVAAGHFAYVGSGGGGAIDTAELYDPATGTWTATGSLAGPRRGHAATLLPDGRVLVVGGVNSGYYDERSLETAEIYDPATGAWTATGSLAIPGNAGTATLLPNGKVLVTGGFGMSLGILDAAELYDPGTGLWSPTASLMAARLGHTATLLPNGGVLVAAGFDADGNVAAAELYDPVSETWSAAGTLDTPRYFPSATLLNDGAVLFAGGSVASGVYLANAEIYVGPPPSLLNISTRLDVRTGDNVLISGFIIAGSRPATVVLRGMGSSLAMPGALADPMIEVHDSSGAVVAMNDNWQDDPGQEQQILASGLAPANELESALYQILEPGAYTLVLKGQDETAGMGLTEVYVLDQGINTVAANISTRGLVRTDDNVLIGGFIVGEGPAGAGADVVVRALGPSLPVPGALANPTLELHDASGNLIGSNDDWKIRPDGSSQQAAMEATALAPGNDSESALAETLPPGSYTAIVRGKDNGVGVGLIEIYALTRTP